MAKGTGDALAMTQAALIGQTFGMLSGVLNNLFEHDRTQRGRANPVCRFHDI